MIQETLKILSHGRFNLSTEASLKVDMKKVLDEAGLSYQPEFVLDKENRPDFFGEGIALEVKIKGTPKSIFKQCARYCNFDQVKTLILVTNKSMGFPKTINGKDCYVVNLGKAWL